MTLISSEQAGEEFEELKTKVEKNVGNIIEKDDDWYYGDKKYLTNSSMGHLIEGGPQTLQAYYEKERKETEAFIFGKAIHCYLLEPDMFSSRYYCFDDTELCIKASGEDWEAKNKKPRNTKIYKEGYAAILEANSDRDMLSEKDLNSVKAMVNKLMQNKQIRELVESAYSREVIYSKVIDGVEVKCKVDSIKPAHFILDYKSTKDPATLKNAYKAMRKYHYDRQGAFYLDITDCDTFYFLFQEKTFPYTFCLAELSPESREIGTEKYKFGLDMYKRFFKNGHPMKNVESYFENGMI